MADKYRTTIETLFLYKDIITRQNTMLSKNYKQVMAKCEDEKNTESREEKNISLSLTLDNAIRECLAYPS